MFILSFGLAVRYFQKVEEDNYTPRFDEKKKKNNSPPKRISQLKEVEEIKEKDQNPRSFLQTPRTWINDKSNIEESSQNQSEVLSRSLTPTRQKTPHSIKEVFEQNDRSRRKTSGLLILDENTSEYSFGEQKTPKKQSNIPEKHFFAPKNTASILKKETQSLQLS